jgi:hypothetical protein
VIQLLDSRDRRWSLALQAGGNRFGLRKHTE